MAFLYHAVCRQMAEMEVQPGMKWIHRGILTPVVTPTNAGFQALHSSPGLVYVPTRNLTPCLGFTARRSALSHNMLRAHHGMSAGDTPLYSC